MPPSDPPPSTGPAPPAKDRTTLWGVLGIVIGVVCCPLLGVVFGFLSLQEARRAGRPPTIGYVALALSVVAAITQAVLSLTGALRLPGAGS